ncbi:MAG: polysaccharide biosynthesis C-terminal domain-containing protein [Clostridia bacterium]|nr:polysaccharide biosynthesis C-terminal domain-containing protein [Clostridia bacterium]
MSPNTRAFLRSAATLSLTATALRAASVVFGAAVARRVGAEAMGLFSLVGSVSGFSVTLAVSGVYLAVTRMVAEALGRGREGEARRALRHALLYALFFGSVATVSLFFLAPLLGGRVLRDARTVPSLRLFSLSLCPVALATVWQGWCTAAGRVRRLAVGQAAEQCARMLLVWRLVSRAAASGAEAACVALVAGGALADGLSCAYFALGHLLEFAVKGGGIKEKPSFSIIRRLFRIAGPVALSAYVRSALLAVEHALIPSAVSRHGRTRKQALSDYGELQGMALPVVLFPGALLYPAAGLLIPAFSERCVRGERESIRRLCGRVMEATLAFSVLCLLLFAACSRPLGRLLYASDTAGRYILVLSFVLPVMFCDHVADCMLKGLGDEVWCMWVNILDAALSIFLVLLLLPRMGAVGYAVVIIIAEIVNFSLSFWRLERRCDYRPAPARHLVLPALCALFAYLAVTALWPPAPSAGVCSLVVRMTALSGAYLLFLFGFSVLSARRASRAR